MGDRFENISNSTLINRSVVQSAFNKVASEHDRDTARALKLIADEIERSGSKGAAETFNSFAEELHKSDPRKPVLRTLWNGVVAALPTVVQMTDAVSKITALFTG